MKASDLKWGQTPFDDMTREELLDEVRAYHMALESMMAVGRLCRYGQEASPFWGRRGTGGRAMMLSQTLRNRIIPEDDIEASENVHRVYFRYAQPILFPEVHDPESEWYVNERGEMLGGTPPDSGPLGQDSNNWRKITRDDLSPIKKEG